MKKLFQLMIPGVCVAALTANLYGWAASDQPKVEEVRNGQKEPASPPQSKARLEAIEPEFNFGSVRSTESKLITHSFVFRNAGEETLVINNVKPSCGCTSAIASATQIAPGASATITASLNPKGKTGNQTITVRANSNDPTNPSQVFRMTGTILAPWRVMPSILDMGPLGKLQSATKEVTITSQYLKEDTIHRITHIKVANPNIRAVTVEKAGAKGPEIKGNWIEVQRIARVTVSAGTAEGQQNHRIEIATDDPHNPTQTVTVRWTVEGDLTVIPKKVYVSELRGRKVPKDLIISSKSGTAFDVTDVAVQGPKGNGDIEVTLKPDSTATKKVYAVTPNIQSDAPKETREGKIVFKTTNPEVPLLNVPYSASYRK